MESKEEKEAVVRDWQCGKTIKLRGINILGESREYSFKEMNQEFGTMVFHEYVIVICSQWEKFKELIEKSKESLLKKMEKKLSDTDTKPDAESEADAEELQNLDAIIELAGTFIDVLPVFFSWEKIKMLARFLLADHEVKSGKDVAIAGEDGFSGVNDPLELYTAIFYAMLANWPKYFAPLLAGVLGGSIHDSAKKQ